MHQYELYDHFVFRDLCSIPLGRLLCHRLPKRLLGILQNMVNQFLEPNRPDGSELLTFS